MEAEEAEEALYVEVEEAVDVQVEDASGVEAEKDRRSKRQKRSDLWFQNDCEHSAVKIINISLYDYSSLLLVGITQQYYYTF